MPLPTPSTYLQGLRPVSYWRLGETAGAVTAVDAAGTNPGTYHGTQNPNAVPNSLTTAGNTTGWSSTAPSFWINTGATLSWVTSPTPPWGTGEAQVVTTAALSAEGAAAALSGTFNSGSTWNFSVYLRGNAGGEVVSLGLGAASADNAVVGVTLTTGWVRYSVNWSPSSTESTVYCVIRSNSASAFTFFANAAQVSAQSGPVSFSPSQGVLLGQAGALTTGPGATAAKLDGVNGWVSVPDAPSLRISQAVSLAAWIKPTVATLGGILSKWAGVSHLTFFYVDHLALWVDNAGAAVSTVTGLPLNTWSRVVATYDGATASIYVNGVLAASAPKTGLVQALAGDRFQVGAYAGDGTSDGAGANVFPGYVQEAAVFSYALTPAQVALDYDLGVASYVPFAVRSGAGNWQVYDSLTGITVSTHDAYPLAQDSADQRNLNELSGGLPA